MNRQEIQDRVNCLPFSKKKKKILKLALTSLMIAEERDRVKIHALLMSVRQDGWPVVLSGINTIIMINHMYYNLE